MNKEFTIKKNTRSFFRAYIEIIKPFLKGIRNREADVFAEILYQIYIRKDISGDDKFRLVFGKNCRKEMTNHLGITTAIFRNSLTGLRGRNLVRDDNTVPNVYLVIPEDSKMTLSFNFILEN